MKKKLLKITVTLSLLIIFVISLTLSVNNSNNDINLCDLAKIASVQAGEATGDGSCGTGWAYFCGYFGGIPYFPAYEGPWVA